MNRKKLMKKDKSNYRLIFIYSCLFLLMSSLIVLYLLINGKTNINQSSDGLSQHFRGLLYYSGYLKNIVVNLFEKHQLIMPHVDFSFGEGSDIIGALHFHGLGDPLSFLSILVPEKLMPAYYMLIPLIRMYLSGLFFILLCLYMKKDNAYAIVAGALCYAFCFFSLANFTHHINFINPVMIMPLMILGIERILNNDGPFVFVLAVFLGAVCGFYFFYMEVIMTVIYAVVRVPIFFKGNIVNTIKTLLYIGLNSVLALGMAAVVVCPIIYSYLGDSRTGINYELRTLYPPFFYERLLTIYVSNDSAYDLRLGLAAPTLFTLALTLKNYRKHYSLSALCVLSFVLICIPYFGKISNGFSFVSQRWSFVLALLFSYTLVEEWDEIRNNRKYLMIVMAVLLLMTGYSAWSRTERVIVPMFICILFLLVVFISYEKKIFSFDVRQILMIALIMMNILYIEQYALSERGGDILDELLSVEDVRAIDHTSEAYIMKQYLSNKDEGFYRYTGSKLTNNSAITFGTNSTNYYWSITNPSDQLFRKELGLMDGISWQIHGYDNKAELESLANVKYYIVRDSYDGSIPYGFKLDRNFDGYNIYQNEYVIPFGYTYDSAISYDEWDTLNALEKQQSMMRTIVVNRELPVSEKQYDINKLDYSVTCGDGISFENNTIIVEKENATMTLSLSGDPDKEYYVLLSGLNYEDIYGYIDDDHSGSTILLKSSDGRTCAFTYLANSHHYYFGKSGYAGYFGYGDPIDEIKISFSLIGKYTFDYLSVYTKNMDGYQDLLGHLSKEVLDNVYFASNTVGGNITLSKDKYLLLSIPYSKGWKATVDGKEAEVFQANRHYLGIYLSQGNHSIELKYHCPGLKIGALISAVSFILLSIYIYLYKKGKARFIIHGE